MTINELPVIHVIPTMKNISVKGIPIQVVSAKLPGEWIIRGIGVFKSISEIYTWVRPFTLMATPESVGHIEWTEHKYSMPSYLIYGSGIIEGVGWPKAGVFVFHYIGGDSYGQAELLLEK